MNARNPLFGLASPDKQYRAAQTEEDARQALASFRAPSILDTMYAELASVPDTMVRPAYNSDDLYVHKISTGEIVDVVGCSSLRYRGLKAGQEHMPSGYSFCTGFEASRRHLWHKAEANSRLICNARAAEFRKEFLRLQRIDMAKALGVAL
jgi:hypothetical protein